MSKIDSKTRQLYRKTHTFVSVAEMTLLVNYWKAPFDDKNATVQDFEKERDALVKLCFELIRESDPNNYEAKLDKLIEDNRFGYYALRYEHSLEQSQKFPRGYWVRKDSLGFWTILRSAKRKDAT